MPLIFILFFATNLAFAIESVLPKTAFLRVEGSIFYPKLNSKNTRIAFTGRDGKGLTIVHLQDGFTYRVTDQKVDDSFFWAPDGVRLFYRENYLKDKKVQSDIKAYDCFLKKNVLLAEIAGFTSSINLDPRDNRFYVLSDSGIRSHRLDYPTERMSTWKESQKTKLGYWLSTYSQILWVSNRGISMTAVNSNEAKIMSFSTSPNGRLITWADSEERIFYSEDGGQEQFLANGTDPSWNPSGNLILYSKTNRIGDRIVDHDLAITDLKGSHKTLTYTRNSDERFPIWAKKSDTILYTHYNGTDLYEMRFQF